MTNLNESLAIFMGFERVKDYLFADNTSEKVSACKLYGIDYLWRVGDKDGGPDCVHTLINGPQGRFIAPDAWKPTEDLNQAQVVIKKLGEMGLKGHFICALSDAIFVAQGMPAETVPSDFDLVTASAETLCQAAEKVIKGGEA